MDLTGLDSISVGLDLGWVWIGLDLLRVGLDWTVSSALDLIWIILELIKFGF